MRRRGPAVLTDCHEHMTDSIQGAGEGHGALPQALRTPVGDIQQHAEQPREDAVALEDARGLEVVPLLALDPPGAAWGAAPGSGSLGSRRWHGDGAVAPPRASVNEP